MEKSLYKLVYYSPEDLTKTDLGNYYGATPIEAIISYKQRNKNCEKSTDNIVATKLKCCPQPYDSRFA